jgi:ATP-binding cassette subfamily B protein
MATTPHIGGGAPQAAPREGALKRYLGVFQYSRRAMELVWTTSPRLTVALGVLTLFVGVIPTGTAYVGKLIVDAVQEAARTGLTPDRQAALVCVLIEGGLIVASSAGQRGLMVCQSLLRAMLGHRVNVMILEKSLTLSLPQFEDSEFYDKLTRARREASSRPLSLVNKTYGLIQNLLGLLTAAALLWSFSPIAPLLILLAGLPSFIVEAKFSQDAFRLFRWRSPEARKQMYLETVLAREDYAKEVKLFGLGPMFLERYKQIFDAVFGEDRALTIRRGAWGFVVGLVSTGAFYGAYAWVVMTTAAGAITLGDMTMYLLLFKQGQSAVAAMLSAIGGMYEDNLYLSTLYELLEEPAAQRDGTETRGPDPSDGLRFEDVWFRYPGQDEDALRGITLHIPPGKKLAIVGENGSGKTTLIKLLARLYEPTQGRILLDGLELDQWQLNALHKRIGVIFQDFVRYQLTVGENIGAGQLERFEDEEAWRVAAERGMAAPFVEQMPAGYKTQLGKWFSEGRELSGGQWQKIALSRAFMRTSADVLVFDEPTSAMDAEAEAQVFDRVRALTKDQIAILISHRFSTVRMADEIAVLEHGKIGEFGDHAALMALGGRYARLFKLQAAGYQ